MIAREKKKEVKWPIQNAFNSIFERQIQFLKQAKSIRMYRFFFSLFPIQILLHVNELRISKTECCRFCWEIVVFFAKIFYWKEINISKVIRLYHQYCIFNTEKIEKNLAISLIHIFLIKQSFKDILVWISRNKKYFDGDKRKLKLINLMPILWG